MCYHYPYNYTLTGGVNRLDRLRKVREREEAKADDVQQRKLDQQQKEGVNG